MRLDGSAAAWQSSAVCLRGTSLSLASRWEEALIAITDGNTASAFAVMQPGVNMPFFDTFPTTTTSLFDSVIIPDTILPSQFREQRVSKEKPPTWRLMRAIMESAEHDWLYASEARRYSVYCWIMGEPAPIPFKLCCEVLNLEPSAVKARFLANKVGVPERRQPLGHGVQPKVAVC